MPRVKLDMRDRILTATRAVLRDRGQELTLDDVALRLDVTRQAVLYHFPTKDHLLVEVALTGLAEEAEAMIRAVARAQTASEAIRRFLRASLKFHLDDLDRFRLIYVRAQVVPGAKDALRAAERRARIHPLTTRMYDAFEAKLRADPKLPKAVDARELAVAVHLAALGFATMAGELERVHDTMKRPMARYVEALATALEQGLGG